VQPASGGAEASDSREGTLTQGNDRDLEPGPLRSVAAFGTTVPYYVMTYDKAGACTSPRSADHLVGMLAAGEASDVILYSHGWNNDFPTSERLYDTFIEGLSAMASEFPGRLPANFQPVFVGIAWPSTALTFGAEDGPDIAALDLGAVVADLAGEDAAEAGAILAAPGGVVPEQAARLAAIIAPRLNQGPDPDPTEAEVTAEDLLAAWRAAPQAEEEEEGDGFENFGAASPPTADDPQAAGWLTFLDPRWLVRVATVLQMKSRAGVVGGAGVGELVGRILGESSARLFLVGHSYGAKVVLSALASRAPPRKAEAVLLLQPAVSRLCFAKDIGDGREGGFRTVLGRVRNAVYLTFSYRDWSLFRLFHLAVRRQSDIGEMQIAGEPSRFAALGGYGPGGLLSGEGAIVPIASPPTDYLLDAPPPRIVALDGGAAITGHGDVDRREIFWTMLNLLK
jgi:hypothetical protein